MTKPAPCGTGFEPGRLFEVTAPEREGVGTQIRRRRQASLRCEPLTDGRRDPWSPKRSQSGARTLHVVIGRHTAYLHGEKVFDLLDKAGIERRQWDHRRRVWMIPIQFAGDVMAYAEWKQRRVVTCEAAER